MAQMNRDSRGDLHSGRIENHQEQNERKKKGSGIHNTERGQDRAPLIGQNKSRSCTPTVVEPARESVKKQRSASAVITFEADTTSRTNMRRAVSGRAPCLEKTPSTITELEQPADVLQLRRSRSVPLYRLHSNRFELKTSPARISYGIAGYDTNRARSSTTCRSGSVRRSKTMSPEWTTRFRESRMRIRDTCVRWFSRLRE